MARHNSLDALEAEIRATRARLAALLARADRDYAFRPILNALHHSLGRDLSAARPAPENEPQPGTHATRLALPAALLGFALAVITLNRLRSGDGGAKSADDE
jgi:hypothetical protein